MPIEDSNQPKYLQAQNGSMAKIMPPRNRKHHSGEEKAAREHKTPFREGKTAYPQGTLHDPALHARVMKGGYPAASATLAKQTITLDQMSSFNSHLDTLAQSGCHIFYDMDIICKIRIFMGWNGTILVQRDDTLHKYNANANAKPRDADF